MRRLLFTAALLLPALALGAPTPVSLSDTIGPSQLFNGNGQCATVALSGQTGAGFFLGTGSPQATFVPSVSKDGSNWTVTTFVDVSGNTSASIVNPSGFQDPSLVLRQGDRFARVCTTAYSSGSATGFMVASMTAARPPAAGADVTDRAGRLLGHVTVDAAPTTAVTGTFWQATQPVSASSLPLPTGAATSALQTTLSGQLPTVLDGSGFLKTHEQGTATVTGTVTANAGSGTMAVSAAALPLPTGAAADTSVNGILLTQGSTTSGQKGSLHQGAVTTAAPTYTTGQTSPISLTTAGAVRTDASATTQPVSGTVTANAGSGTMAVSAASLPLPTGAAQDATLTGGTLKAKVTGNTGAALDAAGQNAASPANELLIAGQFNTSPTTITTGNVSPIQLDNAGNLKVNVAVGGGTGGTSSTFGAASPGTGTAAGGFVTTSAPTYTTGQMGALSLDTAGSLRVAGSFSAGAAADTAGSLVVLNAACATGTSCGAGSTASVALAGQNSVNVTFSSSTSPVGITAVADCSQDGGTTYMLTGSPASSGVVSFVTAAGVTATSIANPGNTSYALLLPPGCAGATHVQVRLGARTSGSVAGQLRSVTGSPPGPAYAGAVGATSYPAAGVALLAQDSSTATTSRAIKATANGVQVDPSGVTSPVTIASLPALTTGAATIGAVTAPGAAALALDASVTGLEVAQASTTSGQKGVLIQGAVATSAPSYTTAQTSPLSLDTAGNLRVTAADIDVTAGATTISAICTDGNINACTGASTVAVSLAGENSASFSWVNSTFTSTLQADCQLGNGIWQIASAFLTGTAGTANAAGIAYSASSVTGSGSVLCPQGSQAARIRANAAVTNTTSVFGRAAAAGGAFSLYGDGANHLQMIGSVSNDATAIGVGNETLPAVARASGTATTVGRAEKLQISSGAGGLFVEGPVANGATAAGNPLGMAGVGRATSAAPTQVTAGQSSALTTDLEHRLWVAAEHPNGFTCTVDAASASTQCVGLSGSGLSYYIKSVTISGSAAITMKVNSSTTAGNACATAPALVIPTMYLGANTGGSPQFPNGYKVTANSALCCQPSGASGSCIIHGYIAP